MTNDETPMTKGKAAPFFHIRHLVIPSSLDIRHSSSSPNQCLCDLRAAINIKSRHGLETEREEECVACKAESKRERIDKIKCTQASRRQERFNLSHCRHWRFGRRIRSGIRVVKTFAI